jgi:hypothetical protein
MKSIKIYRTELPYAFDYSLFDERNHPKTYEGSEYLFIVKRYDDAGNLVEYTKLDADKKPKFEHRISYDGEKRKIEERKIYHETETSEKIEYAYETDLVRIAMYADDTFYKKIEQKKAGNKLVEESQYDAESNVIEVNKWDAGSRPVYHLDGEETVNEYDEKGNIRTIRHVTGDTTFEESYEYDDTVLKRITYSEKGEDMGHVEFEYTREGEVFVTREREGDDLISETFETKNEKGKVLKYERKEYDEDGNMTESTQQFVYDEAERLIKITLVADPKRTAYLRIASAMLMRSKEMKYDEAGNLKEVLLSNFMDEEYEPESYYRLEYDSSDTQP